MIALHLYVNWYYRRSDEVPGTNGILPSDIFIVSLRKCLWEELVPNTLSWGMAVHYFQLNTVFYEFVFYGTVTFSDQEE
jgi:hypothetical protein